MTAKYRIASVRVSEYSTSAALQPLHIENSGPVKPLLSVRTLTIACLHDFTAKLNVKIITQKSEYSMT